MKYNVHFTEDDFHYSSTGLNCSIVSNGKNIPKFNNLVLKSGLIYSIETVSCITKQSLISVYYCVLKPLAFHGNEDDFIFNNDKIYRPIIYHNNGFPEFQFEKVGTEFIIDYLVGLKTRLDILECRLKDSKLDVNNEDYVMVTRE